MIVAQCMCTGITQAPPDCAPVQLKGDSLTVVDAAPTAGLRGQPAAAAAAAVAVGAAVLLHAVGGGGGGGRRRR